MKKYLPLLIFPIAVAFYLFLPPAQQTHASSFTSSQTGDWGVSSTWGGAGVPAAGDKVTISDGTTVTVSDTRVIGSNSSGIGNAITVHGTSSTTFGTLLVSGTGNLTVRGFDIFDLPMAVQQFGHVTMNSGSILFLDLASDAQAYIANNGIFHGNGATISGNANWNTSGSVNLATIGFAGSVYDNTRNLVNMNLGNVFISNSTGTGIGSFGNTSITNFASTTPSNVLTTEVSSIDQVTSQGKYFVDYNIGVITAYNVGAATMAGTLNYKYLVTTSSAIKTAGATTYNEFTCDSCTFNYLGSRQGDNYQALIARNILSTGAGGVSQTFSVTNSTFNYVNRPLAIQDATGTPADPITFNNNKVIFWGDDVGVSGHGITTNGDTSNVSVQGNTFTGRNVFFTPKDTSQLYSNNGWNISTNVFHGCNFIDGEPNADVFPNSIMKNNVMVGFSGVGDNRMVDDFGGTKNNTATTTGNLLEFVNRAINYVAYYEADNNVILYSPHHGISGPVNGLGDSYVQDVNFNHNIIAGNINHDGGAFEYGYNYRYFYDNVSFTNNTIDGGTSGHGTFSWADNLDSGAVSALTNANSYNNIIANANQGVEARVSTTDSLGRLGIQINDYNDLYNNTSNYLNFNQFSTFTDGAGNYNTDGARHILGATLFNPNYSTASNKSLVMTYPSSNQPSLAWDGGTAIALRSYNGTTTSAATTAVINSTLTDTNQSWPTDFTNSTTPTGMWLKIISGTGSGQVQRITNNTATTLTLAFPWTVTPDTTSVYGIYKSVVTLKDSGGTNTVDAGIDMRTLPTTAQTDTGISFNVRSLNANPTFTDNTRTIMSWNVTQGGTADEWAAITRLSANPTLIASSLLPYLQAGWLPTNTALKGTGFNGLDIGAVPFAQTATTTYHAIGIKNGKLIYK